MISDLYANIILTIIAVGVIGSFIQIRWAIYVFSSTVPNFFGLLSYEHSPGRDGANYLRVKTYEEPFPHPSLSEQLADYTSYSDEHQKQKRPHVYCDNCDQTKTPLPAHSSLNQQLTAEKNEAKERKRNAEW